MDKKKLLEELLVDEQALLQDLVEKSKNLIGIGSKTGEVYIKCDRSKLRHRDIISLFLLGAYFAQEMNLIEAKFVDRSSLAKKVGTSEKIVSARISDLKKENMVGTNDKGQYSILLEKVPEYLDYINKKLE